MSSPNQFLKLLTYYWNEGLIDFWAIRKHFKQFVSVLFDFDLSTIELGIHQFHKSGQLTKSSEKFEGFLKNDRLSLCIFEAHVYDDY